MRIAKRIGIYFLAVIMLVTVVPIAALAAVDYNNLSLRTVTFKLEDDEFKQIIGNDPLFNKLPTTVNSNASKFIDVDEIANSNHPVTINKPENYIDIAGSAVYECIGVIKYDTSKFTGMTLNTNSVSKDDITKFDYNETLNFNFSDENIYNNKWVIFAFIWQKTETVEVTYDFSGPNDATSVYPVVAKYKLEDKDGSGTAPYSLTYFTVGRNESFVNLIWCDDAPKTFKYDTDGPGGAHVPDKNTELMAQKTQMENNKLKVSATKGKSTSLPMLAQHRNVTVSQATAWDEVFYPVVGFVAVGADGKYYELTGWKVDGNDQPVATGLYGGYTPSAATTLKADWKEITTLTAADPSTIPEVPLLKTYDIKGNTYGVQLSQKTTGYSGTDTVITGKDRLITYDVKLQFSDLFSSSDMPWSGGGAYFKTVDNANFADLDVDVKLDDNLVPYADEEGYTTIIIRSASLKITGIEIDGVALTSENANGTKNSDGSYTIKAKLNGAKEFTIDFDWDEYSTGEMSIEIPTKAVDGFTGEITGTGVTVTGHMDFTKAHDQSATSESEKADFSADEFVRYLLAYDETWFNKYGGVNMTLTQMLQAARDVQAKLSSFTIESNKPTATVSANIENFALDQTEVSIHVNGTATVTPVFTPDTVTNKEVTWTVNDEGKEVVRVENGVITGLKPGTATVTCTSVYDDTMTDSVSVTVNGVVYVEPTTGGTVAITGDDVTPITGADAYSVSGEVTVEVTPNSGNSMAGEKPSVYYYEANGNKKFLEDGAITKNQDGKFTFSMPEGVATVYVSVPFVIENGNGKTVIGDSKTDVVGTSTGYDEANKLEVEMTPAAQEQMLQRVAQEGGGTKYNDQALKDALSSASVSATGDVYRHIQTRANIEVKSYEATGLNTGKLELDIEYQFRVVASTVADPDKLDFDRTKNAAIVEPGDTEGWTEYESTEATYIVVPVTDLMGKPGEWIKATHTHGDKTYTHYLKIENDNTVTYVNLHEGNSLFTFEGVPGVKDIRINNAGSPVDMNIAFNPGKNTYSATVGSDVERLTLNVDTAGTASLVNNITVELNGETLISGNATSPQYELNLVNNSVNRVKITYSFGGVTQPYTINITRGTLPVPPSPSTYTVKTEEVENATVVTSASSARAGETVTVTVTPAESYHVSGVTVTAANGTAVEVKENEDGTYTFTMPASNVTVTATVYKCPSLAYTDLDVTQWYHPYVDYAITHDLMEGVGDGVFAPEKTVTRAQMAGILWNLEGQPVVNYLMTFTDVPDGKWYTEAIRWAASEGIISGFGDGTFRPEDTITREQMAAMLYFYERKLGSGGFTGDWEFHLTFDDAADISPWAREAVAWCTMKGVITGSDNKFNPSGSSKRAHLATILALYDQLENN